MEKNDSELKVIVLDTNTDIRKINDVKIVRIKSDNYNLYIMKNYWPTVGQINGDVSIELSDNNIQYNNIKGFFSISHNVFNLIVRSK